MPGKAVIVISFDEPDDNMILGGYIEAAQQGFPALKKPGTKISMGINDVADRVIAIFEPLNQEKEDDDGPAEPEEGPSGDLQS